MTLEEYLPIVSDAMSFIAAAAESIEEIDEIFSVTDLTVLLNKVCMPIAGEFEVRRSPADRCQIVYVPYDLNKVVSDEEYLLSDFIETRDILEGCLWINEKVLITFIDRRLHAFAIIVYFYLGYLMIRDDTFAISHHISFEKILKGCDALPEMSYMKHRTTLLRALADLQDAGLIKWNAKARTFEILHITPYAPNQRV